jgi:uncharacterized protein
MTRIPPVRLRPVTDADRAAVLRLNEVEVDLLAPMDEQRLELLLDLADRFDVIEVDGAFAGFVVTFPAGTAYDSENYRWFSRAYGSFFYYLDRIVLDHTVRRRGVGRVVYDELESAAAAYGRMVLEVNVVPPNEPSLAFHRHRGYAEVGRLGDPDHQVALLAKELVPPAGA